MGERELTYGEAVREAIAEEMRRDPRVRRFLAMTDLEQSPVQGVDPNKQEFIARLRRYEQCAADLD